MLDLKNDRFNEKALLERPLSHRVDKNEVYFMRAITKTENPYEFPSWYSLFTYSVLISYGLVVGVATLIPWSVFSTQWVNSQLLLRSIFLWLFLVDIYYFTRYVPKPLKHFRFYTDSFFTLLEIAIIVNLALIKVIGYDKPIYYTANVNLSLRILVCISPFRLYKLCYMCKSLLSITHSILYSLKSVYWTAIFIAIVIYACSVVATWTLNDVNDEEMYSFYGTLFKSMYTLFTVLTLEGWNEVCNRTGAKYPNCKIFFVFFVCFTTIVVMNVVTGIILDSYNTKNDILTGEKRYRRSYENHTTVNSLVCNALNNIYLKSIGHNFPGGGKQGDKYAMNTLSTGENTLDKNLSRSLSDPVVNNKLSFKNIASLLNQHFKKKSSKDSSLSPVYSPDSVDKALLPTNNAEDDLPSQFYQKHDQDTTDSQVQFGQDASNDPGVNAPVNLIENVDLYGCNYFEVIELEDSNPYKVLEEPEMVKALRSAEIEKYQAYDVLNIYWKSGYKRLTVHEFVIGCYKAKNATERQLLSLEIPLSKRMDNIEKSIAELNTKFEKIVSLLS